MMSLIPSHSIAQWLLEKIDWLLELVGVSKNSSTEEILYVIAVTILAVGVGWCIRKAILFVVGKIYMFRKSDFVGELFSHRVISRSSHIIPPLVFLILIPFAFDSEAMTLAVLQRVVVAYLMVTIGIALSAIMTFLWTHYDTHRNTRNLPLRGVLNVGHGIVWIIVVIVSISVIINKSPAILLTGLGAFAAALMLIFKDSILGFVAGIQISQNDMLHVGDWVVVPSTIANGIVVDVSLSVVKIRNWDNTMVMLPPYTLVSTSFQNWRGMQDSGCRLITQSVMIDNTSIRTCDSSLLAQVASGNSRLAEFIEQQKKAGSIVINGGNVAVNGTIETNLGLLRAYMCQYLIDDENVSSDAQILVRIMQGDATGTPLQIYCYTTTTDWTAYEAIQSKIIEHVYAQLPVFDLRPACVVLNQQAC